MRGAPDQRVTARHFSGGEFFITFAVLAVLSAGQALVLSAYVELEPVPAGFIWGMAGYWAIVAAVFSLVTHYQIRKRFALPMRRLSAAAKAVAGGDFSVYVEPVHKGDKRDYLDVMAEDFNTMVEELSSIETLKSDFISNVSHEIKTPLAVIQSYAMALQREGLSEEERRDYTGAIVAASRKLTALVSNVLKLSKLENQEIPPAAEPFDLCRQLCDCALSFEELWESKGIAFEADIEDRAVIRADESLLEIVWNNLLSNALKFTEPGGTVTLRQTSGADTVTVEVADTGCGMDEETQRHIFDKFYQGDASHSGEGNGLGLALTHRVLELTGGRLQVASAPGRGSVFTVTLPVDG